MTADQVDMSPIGEIRANEHLGFRFFCVWVTAGPLFSIKQLDVSVGYKPMLPTSTGLFVRLIPYFIPCRLSCYFRRP